MMGRHYAVTSPLFDGRIRSKLMAIVDNSVVVIPIASLSQYII